ncbi:hypothetical protein B7Y92_04055 [Candidatus Saccharibacteria bacterium 32-50-13]|nr:MAG: hypothetical protein B7Y92_04055 [Candidatus Saccharibacteria bacterium 32-50-13]
MSRNRSGFTLVELMLSMSFISVMLMAIALCVIQISTIYSRGETVRQLNQAMRVVATDLENTTAISHPFDVSAAAINAGRLCMGSFTYVWSTPTRTNTVSGGSAIRFGRVSDPARSLCNAGSLSTTTISGDVIELMEAGDRTLMVHSFSITPVIAESAAEQRMYSITMLVGTNNTAAIETTADDVAVCRSPSDASADFTYCAINEFTITVRAGIR